MFPSDLVVEANWSSMKNVWGELGGWNGWNHTIVPLVQFVVLLWKYERDAKGMWWKRMAKKGIEESHERKSKHSVVCVLSQQVRVKSYFEECFWVRDAWNLDSSTAPPLFSGCNAPKWRGGAVPVRVVHDVCTCRYFLSSWKRKSYFKAARVPLSSALLFLIAARFATIHKRGKAYWQKDSSWKLKKKKQNNQTTQPCNLCFCSESRNACDLETALLRKEKLMLSLLSLAFSQPPRGLCYSFNHIRNTGHNWFYKCSQDQKSWILLTLHAGTHPAPQPGVGCWSALWVIPL